MTGVRIPFEEVDLRDIGDIRRVLAKVHSKKHAKREPKLE